MSPSSRKGLVAAVERFSGDPAFWAGAEAEPGLLHLGVEGLGPVEPPVTLMQAGRLRALGTPARYGLGEMTLTDASVRDTWEIPKGAVEVRWGPGFDAILDGMREELGLPSSCRLRAELHSLLVYERGQFFLPHQDSEKHDAMAATLVALLPSEHEGGELVIEKNGKAVERRGSDSALTLTAFYADCRHQVRPVKSGVRVALTFNLLLEGGTARRGAVSPAAVAEVAEQLRDHFKLAGTKPGAARRGVETKARRLAYLLDHQYTARGLKWNRLKGGDANRARLLKAAAEQSGCGIMLALTEIQETYEAIPEENSGRRGRSRYRGRDDDGLDTASADVSYRVASLIESSIRLVRWIGPDGKGQEISLQLDRGEICAGTANSGLQPYKEEFEGYMGNYGNTVDRWYRRAALVLFPADRAFALRSEASPTWAMADIRRRARAGEQADPADLAAARHDAAELAPFWDEAVGKSSQPRWLGEALSIADALDDAAAATLLLAPFHPEHLRIPARPLLVQLTRRYGAAWTSALADWWFADHRSRSAMFYAEDSLSWYLALPVLCSTLTAGGAEDVADTLAELAWDRLLGEAAPLLEHEAPSRRDAGLAKLGEPLAAVIAAAERCPTPAGLTRVVSGLGGLDDGAAGWIVAALRAAAARASGQLSRGYEPVAAEAVRRLRARLSRSARAAEDWSIKALTDCPCALCSVLNSFLTDQTRRVFEWRLAKQNRHHVHSRIDDAELPVSHETRRQGSPFTLVLTKKEALFADERAARREDEADLAWLATFWKSGPRSGQG